MKSFFLQLLSEKADVSMTRFVSLGCLIISGLIAIFGLYKGSDINALSMLVSAFLVPSITGKVVSKFAEVK